MMGTPCQKNVLIENGILKGYLYDLKTAKQEVFLQREMGGVNHIRIVLYPV